MATPITTQNIKNLSANIFDAIEYDGLSFDEIYDDLTDADRQTIRQISNMAKCQDTHTIRKIYDFERADGDLIDSVLRWVKYRQENEINRSMY